MLGRSDDFRPLASRGRNAGAVIVLVFALFTALGLILSIWTTTHAGHRATVLQVASRQRTLAERYAKEVLLVRQGAQADPAAIASALERSAAALLEGGTAPAVNGDDDKARVPAASGAVVIKQLEAEQHLIHDLVATGSALLTRRAEPTHLTGGERFSRPLSRVQKLTVLTGLTSNVSLNVARSMGVAQEDELRSLMREQILLGVVGLIVFALLSWMLVRSTRRQSAHFRSLVASTTDLVLAFSGDRCRYASSSVLQMLGRAEHDVLREGFLGFVHSEDRTALLRVLSSGEPSTVGFRLADGHGTWRDLEANVTDLRGDRHVRGIVLNARDVTERNRADAEREILFAQEKLANERLRELDKLKDEFVALASHELRTPLTSIAGYLELLLDGPLTDEQHTFGEVISRNAQRLLVLTNDLLFIAAIEAGQLTVERDEIELGVIAGQAVSAALPAAQNAHVELHCNEPPLLEVTGEASRLGQLLDNLISNAIKFTPAGGRVDVVLGGDGSRAWLEVRDTGIGISKLDQEQIFNKFFRTKAATQAGIQGTGLGLVISKAIAHAHGGTIQVQSDGEAGSVFRVEVPLRLPSAGHVEQPVARRPDARAQP